MSENRPQIDQKYIGLPVEPEASNGAENGNNAEALISSTDNLSYLIRPDFDPNGHGRIVVISNRSVFSAEKVSGDKEGEEQRFICKASFGGLATGMNSALNGHEQKNLWIGWDGTVMDENQHPIKLEEEKEGLSEAFRSNKGLVDYEVAGVRLTKKEIDLYYSMMANGLLWPVFHEMGQHITEELNDPAVFEEAWKTYRNVNKKFATAAIETTNVSDTLWVQDYHLLLLGKELRGMDEERNHQNMNFFLHIPFPSMESFMAIPEAERVEMLEGLLSYDTTAFQTKRDVHKFIKAVQNHFPEARIDEAADGTMIVDYAGRKTLLAGIPISIDADSFKSIAEEEETEIMAQEYKDQVDGREIFGGVSRLDPSKGLLETFIAYDTALKLYPELRGSISLVQAVAPGRLDVPAYKKLYDDLHVYSAAMNESHYKQYGIQNSSILLDKGVRNQTVNGIKRNGLSGLFKAGHGVMASEADGMNLTGLEYVASSPKDGQLIVGKNIGLGERFQNTEYRYKGETPAFLVNPKEIALFAQAFLKIATMPELERMQRNELARQETFNYTIFDWVKLQRHYGKM